MRQLLRSEPRITATVSFEYEFQADGSWMCIKITQLNAVNIDSDEFFEFESLDGRVGVVRKGVEAVHVYGYRIQGDSDGKVLNGEIVKVKMITHEGSVPERVM